MNTVMKKTLRTKITDFFGRRVVYHTIFWILILLILLWFDVNQGSLLANIGIELVNLFFYISAVYLNVLYLIPNYLSEKKFVQYCILLVLSVMLITPLKVFVFYIWFSYLPEAQNQVINDQYWYFLSTFIIVGSSTIFKIISDWARYQRDRKDLQTQTMQSELRFLKSQINPHFLFNTLNNLYALTLKKSDKAPDIVIKLSEMMRYMLYECNEKRVLLSKEVNYLKNYLELERLRQGKNVEINFKVNGQVGEQKIAPLMFIPFLENSFKHGLSNQIAQGYVNIELDVEQGLVHLFIENSKSSVVPAQTHKRSGGIGLVNVRRRLNLLYPNQYKLDIIEQPNSYAVDLTIQL